MDEGIRNSFRGGLRIFFFLFLFFLAGLFLFGRLVLFKVKGFRKARKVFQEAKHLLEIHEETDILRCFANADIETIIFDYIGATKKNLDYKRIRNMRPGQDAIVFKLYITPSETQPIIQADDGVEAKKIQNVYVYCQHLTRIK